MGIGHMQIDPMRFWALTPVEFFAAVDGYLARIGANRDDMVPMTKEEALELFAEHHRKEDLKAQNG